MLPKIGCLATILVSVICRVDGLQAAANSKDSPDEREETALSDIQDRSVTLDAVNFGEVDFLISVRAPGDSLLIDQREDIIVVNPELAKRCHVRDAFTILLFLIVAYVYSQTHEKITALCGLRLSHLCCIAYASLSVAIDISIKNAAQSYGGKFPFHPACAVIVVEMLKFACSALLLAVEVFKAQQNGTTLAKPRLVDVAWLAVPAVIYAGNNMLVFQAIRATPMSTFGVIRETMLIWNVIIWSATFRIPVSATRWVAVFGIFIGCTINQVPIVLGSKFTWGVGWAFLLAFSTALGAVANEYAMKQRACVDINMQNCILYFMCGALTVASLAVTDIRLAQSYEAFFHGFVPECWQVIILQVVTGLAVSRILKYVEAITKTIVAALRGPGVIFISSILFRTPLSPFEVIATVLVCSSSYVYLRQGPLVQPTSKENEQLLSLKASKGAPDILADPQKSYGAADARL